MEGQESPVVQPHKRRFAWLTSGYDRNSWRRICVLLSPFIVLLIICVFQAPLKQVNWRFIIADGYEGFLVIHYNCPAGEPLNVQGDTINVVFTDEGVFCTSNEPFGWEGQLFASTRSGQTIQTPMLWDAKGYGLSGGNLRTMHGPPKKQFTIYWVGELEYLASIRNTIEYESQLDEFLRRHFAIQRPYVSGVPQPPETYMTPSN